MRYIILMNVSFHINHFSVTIKTLKPKQRKKAMDKLAAVKGLTEEDQEMLASNSVERQQLSTEITEMKSRSVRIHA